MHVTRSRKSETGLKTQELLNSYDHAELLVLQFPFDVRHLQVAQSQSPEIGGAPAQES